LLLCQLSGHLVGPWPVVVGRQWWPVFSRPQDALLSWSKSTATLCAEKKIPIVFGPPWKITNSNKNDTRYWSNSDYFDPGRGVRIVAISVCVCLSVCLSVRSHISNTKFPVHVNCGRGSVLLRRKQHIALSSRKDRDMVISTVTCANIWWNLDISLMTLCERTDRQKDIQTRLSEHFAHLPGTMEIVFSG